MKTVLVTGAAGFIGAFLVKKLLESTDDGIVGLDNLNSYYDPGIKEARLRMLAEADTDGRFTFVRRRPHRAPVRSERLRRRCEPCRSGGRPLLHR